MNLLQEMLWTQPHKILTEIIEGSKLSFFCIAAMEDNSKKWSF